MKLIVLCLGMAGVFPAGVPPLHGAELWVGAAQADITPDRPVALSGGMTAPISNGVNSPVTANVLALESRDEAGKPVAQAIIVSCDLVVIRPGIQQRFREQVAPLLPGFDVGMLFLATTHTHKGPATQQDAYDNAIEMHLLRIGELAIATNPFELYTDYGTQIQARSPAGQTILIQLASPLGQAGYLPTPRALAGKGYSAIPQSCPVGPEGGQLLVERTVQGLAALMGEQQPAQSTR